MGCGTCEEGERRGGRLLLHWLLGSPDAAPAAELCTAEQPPGKAGLDRRTGLTFPAPLPAAPDGFHTTQHQPHLADALAEPSNTPRWCTEGSRTALGSPG